MLETNAMTKNHIINKMLLLITLMILVTCDPDYEYFGGHCKFLNKIKLVCFCNSTTFTKQLIEPSLEAINESNNCIDYWKNPKEKCLTLVLNSCQFLPNKRFIKSIIYQEYHGIPLDINEYDLTYEDPVFKFFEGFDIIDNLSFNFVDLSMLPKDLFGDRKCLRSLQISTNSSQLPAILDSLEYLESLQIISLNKNLQNISGNIFAHQGNLRNLNLSGNALNCLKKEDFDGLSSLEHLDLSNNDLLDIPLGIFANQNDLIYLDLSKNHIEQLTDGLFNNTRKLKLLKLSNNKLECLSCNIFKNLTELEILDLAHNNLHTICPSPNNPDLQKSSPFINLINLEEIYLNNNYIRDSFEVKSKQLKYMNLAFNNISSIECNYLNDLTSTIELYGNPLHCDCKLWCLIEFMKRNSRGIKDKDVKCKTPMKLNGRILNQFNEMELTCNMDKNCFYVLLQNDSFIHINCSNVNLSNIPSDEILKRNDFKEIQLYVDNKEPTNLSSGTLPDDYINITLISIVARHQVNSRTLPEKYLSNLQRLKSVHLDLQLTEIPDNLFRLSYRIENLTITGTDIEMLPDYLFLHQHNLIELNLSRNKLKILQYNFFYFNRKLQVLRLSHNLIKTTDFHLPELRWLFLDNNQIQRFSDVDCISDVGHFTDMSFNNITLVNLSTIISHRVRWRSKAFFNFSNNQIETIIYEENASYFDGMKFEFGNNPLKCDYKLLAFVKLFQARENHLKDSKEKLQCKTPSNLKNKDVRTLWLGDLLRPVNHLGCPENCHCFIREFNSVLIVNCTNASLTEIPSLSYEFEKEFINGTELWMEHNQLTELELSFPSGHRNVIKLYAAYNNISSVSSENMHKNICYLDLSNNRLKKLDDQVVEDFKESQSLRDVFLSNNPWICDCSSLILLHLQFKKRFVKDFNQMNCLNGERLESVLMQLDICNDTTTTTIKLDGILLFIIAVFFGIISFLYIKYKEFIHIWMYSHGIFQCCLKEDDLDKHKQYDVFLSYSHCDEDFIAENLIPKLENGPIPYKICLHERDWIVGDFIPDQIIRSVENSKRTIIILSRNYLQSPWALMEFRTAHTYSMREKRARVIVIVYDDIGDINDIENLDPDVKRYIKMYTYLKWNDAWFWKKLYYALPHSSKNKMIIEQHDVELQEMSEIIQ